MTVLLPACPVSVPESGTGWIGSPPGVELDASLRDELSRALSARGPGYTPRTRHLRADGTARYTNRLIRETSPYLLQHAHNPVSWFPWGEEAFAEAKRRGVPVLLSIGYSTCHWCHVMEEESFEDLEIAEYLNRNYVAIKVDREERPDLDSVYMAAVQAFSGRGGWPMTAWLTAEREVFFGGTYFPARDGDRGARVGFLTHLRRLREHYDGNREGVARMADELTRRVRRALTIEATVTERPDSYLPAVDAAVRAYAASFDERYGGRAGAPKFPSSMPVRLLFRHGLRTGDERSRRMALRTLDAMAAGGIHDHVGGGFHRYATDAAWRVPHFEKMLYDNARLAVAYLEAYQVTGAQRYADLVRRTLRYVAREMTAPEGGFFSATDADSRGPDGEREEGRFFTWTLAEMEDALGEDAPAVAAAYGVTAEGNFAGRNVLYRPHRPAPGDDLTTARARLYRVRSERDPPARDEKIITAWNGLMVSAMARAAFVLGESEWRERAAAAARFVLAPRVEGRGLRRIVSGDRPSPAFLDDYAFLVAGLLDLYESTADLDWLERAIDLQAVVERDFRDPAGGYYFGPEDHERLLAREKPVHDGAEPSGNSVTLANLTRLHALTGDDLYRLAADALLAAFTDVIVSRPSAVPELLLGLSFREGSPVEVALIRAGDEEEAEPLLSVLRRTFAPNRVQVSLHENALDAHAARVPWLRGKVARRGEATAYVCERGACKLPTSDPDVLRKQLTSSGQKASAP